jgi:hypothetical protein
VYKSRRPEPCVLPDAVVLPRNYRLYRRDAPRSKVAGKFQPINGKHGRAEPTSARHGRATKRRPTQQDRTYDDRTPHSRSENASSDDRQHIPSGSENRSAQHATRDSFCYGTNEEVSPGNSHPSEHVSLNDQTPDFHVPATAVMNPPPDIHCFQDRSIAEDGDDGFLGREMRSPAAWPDGDRGQCAETLLHLRGRPGTERQMSEPPTLVNEPQASSDRSRRDGSPKRLDSFHLTTNNLAPLTMDDLIQWPDDKAPENETDRLHIIL